MERNWSRLILIFIVAFIAFTMISCDAHKQLSRLIRKNPELVRDTSIVDYDTTVFHIPAVHKDSVVHIRSFMTDTIYLKQDRLTVRTYVYNDSVYIEGECAEVIDTVIVREEIKVPYIVNEQNAGWLNWFKENWPVLLCLIALIYMIKTKK